MEQQKNNISRQILVAVIANISSAGFGLAVGWSSPIVPKLRDVTLKDTPLDRILTANEVGWIGSLVPIGGIIAPFFAGSIANKFGRKTVILLSGFILLISFLILGTGHSLGLIYTARLMQGICIGLTKTVIPMYIGEIAQVSVRGGLGTFMTLFLQVGLLFSYCVGPFVPYATFQFICMAFPITSLILMSFMPETPTYYLLSGYRGKAIKSLTFLRNASEEDVLTELELIQRSVKHNQTGSWKQLFTNRGNMRALTICCGLLMATVFSGSSAIIYYAQTIFIRAGTGIAPEYASIILVLTPFTISWCVPFAIERIGRRIHLMISVIGSGIGLALLSLYFFLDQYNVVVVENLSYLPVVSMIIYSVFYVTGYSPVPWAIVGEIFTPDIKALAATTITMVNMTCSAIVLQLFEDLNEAVGPSWVFGMFTVSTSFCVLFIYFYVIETKGLTLLEIQEKLNSK